MHVTWAQKLKSDALQASSNSRAVTDLSYTAEVRDEHIQISGIKFMQLESRPLRLIRGESNVDALSLFYCSVLTRLKH